MGYIQQNDYSQGGFAGLFSGSGCPRPTIYKQGRGCYLESKYSKSGKAIACAVTRTSVVKHPSGKYSLKCFDNANPQDSPGGGGGGTDRRVSSSGRGTNISASEDESFMESDSSSLLLWGGLAVAGVVIYKKFIKKKKTG